METIGRYQLVRLLGRGAMGEVWAARDPVLERDVAIKRLLPEALDQRARRRFRRERQTLGRLVHENIVRIHTAEDDRSGAPCIVMDLVPGESLAARLERDGRVPPGEAVAITAKLARALQSAHGEGVLHRDVKPENILLRADGEPLLTDFGLAGLLAGSGAGNESGGQSSTGERLTVRGVFMGTAGYAAPEQATGDTDATGPTADVYGLGATLYLMLTGRVPFEQPTVVALLRAQLGVPPPPPSTIEPAVPSWLDRVVERCLAPEPEDRFESAAAFAHALERHRPSTRGPVAAPAAKASTPRPVVALAVTVVIVAALVTIGGVAMSRLGPEDAGGAVGAGERAAAPTRSPVPETPPPVEIAEAGDDDDDAVDDDEPTPADPQAMLNTYEVDTKLGRLTIIEPDGAPAELATRLRAGERGAALRQALDAAIASDPEALGPLALRAVFLLAERRDAAEAASDLRALIARDRRNELAWRTLLGEILFQRGETQATIEQLGAIVGLTDEGTDLQRAALAGYAALLQMNGELERSLAALNRILEHRPDLDAIRATRAEVLTDLHRPAAARADLDRLRAAGTIEPGRIDALEPDLLRLEGRVPDALDYTAAVLKRDPEFYPALAGRALILIECGLPDRALEALRRALVIKPTDPFTTIYAARAHASAGRATSALSTIEGVLTQGAPLIALESKAIVLAQQGRVAEARRLIDEIRPRAAAMNGVWDRIRFLLDAAAVARAAGHDDEAERDLTAAIDAAPRAAEALYRRGALRAKTDPAAAEEDLDEAIRLNDWHLPARLERAGLHAERGELDEADADLDRILEITTSSDLAIRHRTEKAKAEVARLRQATGGR